ncbi:MAG: ABC transporter ATP-binding protein [Candidatus Omnitrophica bacterium]|nr:ABC transporter ATP-binding protein [Candidatus Omnitrophota bacterium]
MADIQIKNLSKWYGEVLGVSNITAHIQPGVIGLLGPNGAGKSTLLKILTGQLRADTGGATIGGIPVWNRIHLYEIIGFCPDMEKFYERLTGWEFLTYMARLHGMSKSKARKTAREALHIMGLDDAIDKRIGAYSKGMRQRVKFAQAILHDPEVIFLDEPMQGMDPIGRLQTAEMIREYGRRGKTILVSSHILNEVEDMTHRILVLNHGQLLAEGDVHEIRELIEEQPRHVRILCPERRKLSNILVGCSEVQTITFGDDPGELMVQTLSPDAFYQRLPDMVMNQGLSIDQIETLDDNLESVFEYLVK